MGTPSSRPIVPPAKSQCIPCDGVCVKPLDLGRRHRTTLQRERSQTRHGKCAHVAWLGRAKISLCVDVRRGQPRNARIEACVKPARADFMMMIVLGLPFLYVCSGRQQMANIMREGCGH